VLDPMFYFPFDIIYAKNNYPMSFVVIFATKFVAEARISTSMIILVWC